MALDGRSVDVLLDGVGGELGTWAFALVADGGRVSAHGAAGGGFAEVGEADARTRGIVVRGIADVQFDAPEIVRLTTRALEEATAGRLRPVIAREFPPSEAVHAHRAMEARAIAGKALLIP
ncbi:zinc-binding dehydrogenase [Embleya sp. NPDC050154]|uniref:zinc-binding dehydrogenase n=1 Tax=Embleya sp. NPDC050154 TaxID=3363988 RepID=UPI0037AF81D0